VLDEVMMGGVRGLARRLRAWPAAREFAQIGDVPIDRIGLGPETVSDGSRALRSRTEGADVVSSICPYCAVGCAQLVYTKNGKIVDIEGDPRSPINQGTLCPKGAATYGMLVNPLRVTKVKYRAPYADRWEERSLEWAMERIAQLIKRTRDETFVERDGSGKAIAQCTGIAHLGGATLDNEENYLIKKLWTGGLGIVWIENQARI
jgi:formate dehydrogenase major subunit